MKKLLIVTLMFVFSGILLPENEAKAQVLDGIYEKEHVPSRRPVPYPFLREADLMWTKRIWRCIDLRQKMNFHFYYPVEQINDRMNLTNLLVYGQTHEGVVLYNPSIDDRFTSVMTTKEIEDKFGAGTFEKEIIDENGNVFKQPYTKEIDYGEIRQIWLKEDWYFDRQRSKMEVRIIGIMPIRFFEDENTKEIRKAKVFWAYFPAVRPILANHEVYNRFNDAKRKTYDDIFFKRFFDSYIVQESNIQEDRPIGSYRDGLTALWEAEDIKNKIFKFEQELWSY